MHKVYLLLRNNKQLGPFTLEELLQHQLKPFDLVWLEGKSAGWRYPSEVEAIKPFLSEDQIAIEPEKKIVHEAFVNKEETPVEEKPVQVTAAVPLTGIKSKKVYIRLPTGNMVPSQKPAPDLSSQLEAKAEALYQRAQAFASGNKINAPEEETDIDTKYSRSLEDIKQEYSAWLYQKKTARKGFSRKHYMAILGLGLGGLLIWGGTQWFGSNGQEPPQEQTMAILPINQPEEEKKLPVKKKTATVKKSTRKPVATASTKKSQTKPVKPLGEETGTTVKETEKKTSENSTVSSTPVSTPHLPDLIRISTQFDDAGKGVPDFKITLINNSSEQVQMVAVDIYYFRMGKQLEKKTVYFSDINAHSSKILTARGHRRADDVQLKMGLMTSKRGEIFYANN
jgi:hypothetical protein